MNASIIPVRIMESARMNLDHLHVNACRDMKDLSAKVSMPQGMLQLFEWYGEAGIGWRGRNAMEKMEGGGGKGVC